MDKLKKEMLKLKCKKEEENEEKYKDVERPEKKPYDEMNSAEKKKFEQKQRLRQEEMEYKEKKRAEKEMDAIMNVNEQDNENSEE